MNTPRNNQARNHSSFKRIRKQLLEHDSTCNICGNEGDTIDHIRPVDTFPNPLDANTLENCRVLCRSCNSRLGARYVNAKTSGRDVPGEVIKRLEQAGIRAERKLDGVFATKGRASRR